MDVVLFSCLKLETCWSIYATQWSCGASCGYWIMEWKAKTFLLGIQTKWGPYNSYFQQQKVLVYNMCFLWSNWVRLLWFIYRLMYFSVKRMVFPCTVSFVNVTSYMVFFPCPWVTYCVNSKALVYDLFQKPSVTDFVIFCLMRQV